LYAAAALSDGAERAGPVLFLVRHAAAFDKSNPRRALSVAGIKDAQVLARALSLLHCRPQVIASSRLGPALHTADFLARGFSFAAPLVRKQCLMPGTDASNTIAWLETLDVRSSVCVGHMPHLSQVARALIKPGPSGRIELKKASVCCISFFGEIKAGAGTLEWYYPQKRLRRIVDRITRRT
jgi:phosphohistidine phosphatase SixA